MKDIHIKCYVCVHVFEDTRPVLLVSRPDGDWCFLCGADHANNANAYRVVGIGHVLENDISIDDVMDLKPDWEAERKDIKSDWIRTPIID
ncbi:hypothetical protein [Diaphorobacter aerolatus]|uniref:Uncharacterized protein n=1 Tax=Diaphorobacter aerolatus TaxID=1288495 RepID=A0A7H0GKU1_9BURK|nr:hypothetical protein [Diaphorobacter aerolatus]QNP48907.1 hypothetical protein H9K75_01505 [Diaphorobacter aerolatus]